MKQFYTHLVEVESINVSLDELELSSRQKLHLATLVDKSLHHKVLDVVLSKLSEVDKKVFLTHLKSNSHHEIWKLLKEKSDNIEAEIKKAITDLREELKKDLQEAKTIKEKL